MKSNTAILASAWLRNRYLSRELTLERGEEALAHRVVVGIADRAHGGRTPACLQRSPKAIEVYCVPWSEWWIIESGFRCQRAMFRAWSTSVGPQVRLHRPADDSAAPGIDDDRQVQEAAPGRNVGDVSHPQLIGPIRREVPVHQVRGRARVLVPLRRAPLLPSASHPAGRREP